jgi:hypothetical protein
VLTVFFLSLALPHEGDSAGCFSNYSGMALFTAKIFTLYAP